MKILITGFSDFGAYHITHELRKSMQFITAADLLAKLLSDMGHTIFRGVPVMNVFDFDVIIITCVSPNSSHAKYTKEMIQCLQHKNVILLMDDRRVKKHISGLAKLSALNQCSNRKFKMLCTTITDGCPEVQKVLDERNLSNIQAISFNPTSIMLDVLGVHTMAPQQQVFHKQKQWICTSLPDITKSMRQKYPLTWPVKYYNKNNFKSEAQLCIEDYQESAGMIVDYCDDSIPNWWRTRYMHAMIYEMLLLTDTQDIQDGHEIFAAAKDLLFIQSGIVSNGYLTSAIMQQKLYFLSHAPTMTALQEKFSKILKDKA